MGDLNTILTQCFFDPSFWFNITNIFLRVIKFFEMLFDLNYVLKFCFYQTFGKLLLHKIKICSTIILYNSCK